MMEEPTDWIEKHQARAEAAEASAHDAWGQRNAIYAELTKAQARAEAAEKHVAFLRDALGEEHQSVWRDAKLSVSTEKAVEIMLEWNASADRAEARAEAAEDERDEFRRALDKGLPPTIEAQSEINHWRERAKDMEKALQEIVDNTSERSLASNIARAALEATP
jgi:chromosome segregation ATPase